LNEKAINRSYKKISLQKKQSKVRKRQVLTKKATFLSFLSSESNPGKIKFVSSAVEGCDVREEIE